MLPTQGLPTEDTTAGELARQLGTLLGTAYHAPDNTRNAADLLALGGGLADARETNTDALDEAFADTATALLAELEELYGLPVRTDLTTAQRQTRLVAKVRAKFAGTVQDIRSAVRALDPTATVEEIDAALVAAAEPDPARLAATRRNVFRFVVIVALATYLDVYLFAQIRAVLEQQKPAHTTYTIATGVGFKFDDADSLFDRQVLSR